jgi:hypothetical protein
MAIVKKMDKYLYIIDRSYTQFLKTLGTKSIDEYFDIEEYRIHCVQSELHRYTVTIRRGTNPNTHVLYKTQLPIDVIRHIYCFLEDKTEIVSELIFSSDYPFKAHKCRVVTAYQTKYDKGRGKVYKESILVKLALQVAIYNKQLSDSWITSALFENHILCYVTHILSLL